jgi:hypothetical protein
MYSWMPSSARRLMIGPTSVVSSRPSPRRSFSVAPPDRSTSSAMYAFLHDHPRAGRTALAGVPKADHRIPSTARSRSASSMTMTAFLPPSSRLTFFKPGAANSDTRWPASVEPVKDTTLTGMGNQRLADGVAWPRHDIEHPGGKPASSKILTNSIAQDSRIGRGLEYDGVAGHKGRQRFPAWDRNREVPGGDDCDHTNGVTQRHAELVRELNRSRIAQQPAPSPPISRPCRWPPGRRRAPRQSPCPSRG